MSEQAREAMTTRLTDRIETITPARAEEYLAMRKPDRQRSVKPHNLKALVGALNRGEWQMNGESIKFDWDGNLIDGQHRLLAVVATRISIETKVIRGLDPATFCTIDTGSRRSGGDTLSALGVKYYNRVATALRWIESMTASCGSDTGITRSEMSNEQMKDALARHESVVGIIESLEGWGARDVLVVPGAVAAVYYIARKTHAKKADAFFEQLCTGELVERGEPVYALRAMMIRERSATKKAPSHGIARAIIHAWNAHVSGKSAHRFTLRVRESAETVVLWPKIR